MEIHKAFSWKRDVFSHEKEVRLFSNVDNNYLLDEEPKPHSDLMLKAAEIFKDKGEITEQEYKNFVEKKSCRSESNFHLKHISFSHIPEFIESVMVHPTAADWYVHTVEQFCKKYQINFVGKSNMYKFTHQ